MSAKRPTVGKLTVPYMVDERIQPIDFKAVHAGHVRKCAEHFLCGICGKRIVQPFAFVGPNDGRRCFADPWMHVACARLAMEQCPFLADRRGWREREPDPLLAEMEARYEHNMALFIAPDARSHRDDLQELALRGARGPEAALMEIEPIMSDKLPEREAHWEWRTVNEWRDNARNLEYPTTEHCARRSMQSYLEYEYWQKNGRIVRLQRRWVPGWEDVETVTPEQVRSACPT